MFSSHQKKIIWAILLSVPQVIACILLLWALTPGHRYGYFVLLRWVCCPIFAYVAFHGIAKGNQGLAWGLGMLAVAYNPVIRVHLTKDTWSIINVVAIAIAVASVLMLNGSILHMKEARQGEEKDGA